LGVLVTVDIRQVEDLTFYIALLVRSLSAFRRVGVPVRLLVLIELGALIGRLERIFSLGGHLVTRSVSELDKVELETEEIAY